MQQCPSTKSVWCEALRPPLVRHVPLQQLHDTLQLLAVKELRMRHEPPALPEPESEQSAAELARLRALDGEAPPPSATAASRNQPYSSFTGGTRAPPLDASSGAAPGGPAEGGLVFALSGRRAELAPSYSDTQPSVASRGARAKGHEQARDGGASEGPSQESGSSDCESSGEESGEEDADVDRGSGRNVE